MTVRSLFEAIGGDDIGSGSSETSLLESIASNLDRLYNARQGSVGHLPEYGLPEFARVYADKPETLGDLKKAIQRSTEMYEPRLLDVRVNQVESEHKSARLVFEVTGRVVNHGVVRFETTFAPDRLVHTEPQ